MAITLWRLASNADYRMIGHLFGVSKGSVCVINKEVCMAITTVLAPKYIRIPSGNNLKEVLMVLSTNGAFLSVEERLMEVIFQ